MSTTRDDLAKRWPPELDPDQQRLLDQARTLHQAAAGNDQAGAMARGARAVTPHVLAWFAAELERGTDPGHLAAAFNDVIGAALAGFIQSAPRRQPSIDGLLDYHLKAIGIIAGKRLTEASDGGNNGA